jgi:hypothetical protein
MNISNLCLLQYCFLVDSHNARYVKGQYITHVTFLIAQAIVSRTGVPWEEVHRRAWMRGTKSNISEEVAVASETFVPDPGTSFRRLGILKIQEPPSPLPAQVDRPCQRCVETQAPCQQMPGWVACIPCHQMKRKCSLTPISRAYICAGKNRAVLDGSDAATGKVAVDDLQHPQPQILDKIRHLEALQEEVSRGIQDILVGQKRLYEVVSSWMSTEDRRPEKRRRT